MAEPLPEDLIIPMAGVSLVIAEDYGPNLGPRVLISAGPVQFEIPGPHIEQFAAYVTAAAARAAELERNSRQPELRLVPRRA